MKPRIGLKLLCIFVAAAILAVPSAIHPAQGAELQAAASRTPWNVMTFEVDTKATYLSTAFGGPEQIKSIFSWYPVPQYTWVGFFNTYLENSNCGPGGSWFCDGAAATNLNPATLSAVAEYTFINSYKLAVAYEGLDHWVYLLTIEYASDGQPLNHNIEKVFFTTASYSIFGQPSVAFDEYGNAHVAFVFKYSDHHILMYAYEVSTANTSCGTSMKWQCDVILNEDWMIGPPTIVINSSNNPRILYYDATTIALTIAYPKAALLPGTCGPDNSWRCVPIHTNIGSNSALDMAIDPETSQPHLVWTYTDALDDTMIYHAHYVGANGNCGNDASYNAFSHQVVYSNRWDCHVVGKIGNDVLYQYVSIAVDGANNPVMAFNRDNGNTYDLNVAYGIPGDPYTYQIEKVDGKGINTGLQVDLSINKEGRAFIAYIEDREYEPTLKIAYQGPCTYLPMIIR